MGTGLSHACRRRRRPPLSISISIALTPPPVLIWESDCTTCDCSCSPSPSPPPCCSRTNMNANMTTRSCFRSYAGYGYGYCARYWFTVPLIVPIVLLVTLSERKGGNSHWFIPGPTTIQYLVVGHGKHTRHRRFCSLLYTGRRTSDPSTFLQCKRAENNAGGCHSDIRY